MVTMMNSRRFLTAARRAAASSRRLTSSSSLQRRQNGGGLVLANRRTPTPPTTTDLFHPRSGTALRYLADSSAKDEPTHAAFAESDSPKEGEEKASSETKEETEKSPALSPPPPEKMEFQAETRQLLDIVTHSLYTDKEVFLRELISNASDSLEKMRHLQATNQVPVTTSVADADLPLEVRIELDEVGSTITITDTGIGMNKAELIENLGTIAKSGSKGFLKQLQQSKDQGGDVLSGIIGKFGVGFYSTFMVGRKVEFRSKSAMSDDPPMIWSSDGSGTYEIAELPNGMRQDRGSSIVIHFKDEHWDFVDETRIENILKKYSNFVAFPIYLNGKLVNTQKAIWSRDPHEITADEYTTFYKYISKNVDTPLETIHFRADAPLDVRALLFIPQFHGEKYGMERLTPGVSLYCRKVLIEPNSPDILPEWMRFVKGVVDSEDLPLAISREKTQDSSLVSKLRRTLTRKFISHMSKMARKDKEKFLDEFYKEYQFFLKEGMCQDPDVQASLSKMLYFETSKSAHDKMDKKYELVSFDDYIARMRPEQKQIFYLSAPSRAAALNSPYLEAFEKADVEVLFCFTDVDEFVMANLEKYEDRELVSVDKGNIDLDAITKAKDGDDKKDKDGKETAEKKDDDDDDDNIYKADRKLTSEETLEFCDWFKRTLGEDKVGSCTATKRLTSSPAMITDSESGAMRRMMKYVDVGGEKRDGAPTPPQSVEINPKHAIIVGIHHLSSKQPVLSRALAAQVYDNCMVAAGLMDDSRSMLPRLNDILMSLVKSATEKGESEFITPDDYKDEFTDLVDSEPTKSEPTKGEPIVTDFKPKGDDGIMEASYEEKDSKEEEPKEEKKKKTVKKKAASKKKTEKKEKKTTKASKAAKKAEAAN